MILQKNVPLRSVRFTISRGKVVAVGYHGDSAAGREKGCGCRFALTVLSRQSHQSHRKTNATRKSRRSAEEG